jgi:hypothetical protein
VTAPVSDWSAAAAGATPVVPPGPVSAWSDPVTTATPPDASGGPLEEYQFELGGITFGFGRDVSVENFTPVGPTTRDRDGTSSSGDWRTFGKSRKTPGTWEFDLYTDTYTVPDALEALADLEDVWDAEELREGPGDVMALRYRLGGRVGRVYGQPRGFTYPLGPTVQTGRIPIVADFALVDTSIYSDTRQSIPLTMSGSKVGGFRTPFRTPLKSLSTSTPRTNTFTIGGRTPTWIEVEFSGALTRPWVKVGDVEVGLDHAMAYDETIRVDPHPWVQSAIRNEESDVGGILTAETRLTRLRLKPGQYTATFGADAAIGDVGARIYWREARRTL